MPCGGRATGLGQISIHVASPGAKGQPKAKEGFGRVASHLCSATTAPLHTIQRQNMYDLLHFTSILDKSAKTHVLRYDTITLDDPLDNIRLCQNTIMILDEWCGVDQHRCRYEISWGPDRVIVLLHFEKKTPRYLWQPMTIVELTPFRLDYYPVLDGLMDVQVFVVTSGDEDHFKESFQSEGLYLKQSRAGLRLTLKDNYILELQSQVKRCQIAVALEDETNHALRQSLQEIYTENKQLKTTAHPQTESIWTEVTDNKLDQDVKALAAYLWRHHPPPQLHLEPPQEQDDKKLKKWLLKQYHPDGYSLKSEQVQEKAKTIFQIINNVSVH